MTDDYRMERWTIAAAEPDYRHRLPVAITVNDRAATRQAIIDRVRSSGGDFVERSAWGASKSRAEGRQDDWNYTMVAIHHAGRSFFCGDAESQMKDIQRRHQDGSGWSDIGYHYAVSCTGEIYEGTDIRFKGSHLSQYNTGAIGIVLLENLSDPEEKSDPFGIVWQLGQLAGAPAVNDSPQAQQNGLNRLVDALLVYFDIKRLGGHREFPKQSTPKAEDGKICPGNHRMKLVESIRSRLGLSKPG